MGTKVRFFNGTCGPAHDPYGWSSIEVTRLGHTWKLTGCGLRGTRLEKDGKPYGPSAEDREWVFDDAEAKAINIFSEETGARPDQWEKWYYEHVYVEDPMGSLSSYI